MTFQTLANVIIAEDRGDKKYSYLDLVRSSNMRKRALLTGITWWECFVQIMDFMMAKIMVHSSNSTLKRPGLLREDIEFNYFCRFGVAFTYYGISLNISGFGLNLYLTQFIYGAIELPSKLVAYVCLDKLGRRYSQVGTLITTGVCIGITVLIPRGKR